MEYLSNPGFNYQQHTQIHTLTNTLSHKHSHREAHSHKHPHTHTHTRHAYIHAQVEHCPVANEINSWELTILSWLKVECHRLLRTISSCIGKTLQREHCKRKVLLSDSPCFPHPPSLLLHPTVTNSKATLLWKCNKTEKEKADEFRTWDDIGRAWDISFSSDLLTATH